MVWIEECRVMLSVEELPIEEWCCHLKSSAVNWRVMLSIDNTTLQMTTSLFNWQHYSSIHNSSNDNITLQLTTLLFNWQHYSSIDNITLQLTTLLFKWQHHSSIGNSSTDNITLHSSIHTIYSCAYPNYGIREVAQYLSRKVGSTCDRYNETSTSL